ncbi:hypothetical protein AJ87_38120 [Rhizobium yanglingense]|nr:hypothetical protein AJ87_38120 [Rhizobium yanglingense]
MSACRSCNRRRRKERVRQRPHVGRSPRRDIARNQPLEFGAIEFAAEHKAAVGDPQPVAVGKDLPFPADTGAGQKQEIVVLRLRFFLDAEQEGREEVRLLAREGWFVGEDAENAIEALGHAPGDRVGHITRRADDMLHTFAGVLRDARQSCGSAIQHKRDGRLADAG